MIAKRLGRFEVPGDFLEHYLGFPQGTVLEKVEFSEPEDIAVLTVECPELPLTDVDAPIPLYMAFVSGEHSPFPVFMAWGRYRGGQTEVLADGRWIPFKEWLKEDNPRK